MLLSSLVEDMLLSSLVLFGLISKLCVQYQAVIINPDKTKVLLLGTPQMLARVPKGFGVTLLSKEILPPCSAKDLGVIVDSHLSFDEHVTEVQCI